jgi:hypothetical protein
MRRSGFSDALGVVGWTLVRFVDDFGPALLFLLGGVAGVALMLWLIELVGG